MSKKLKKSTKESIKKFLPYLATFCVILAIIFVGSKDKNQVRQVAQLDVATIAKSGFNVSAGQLTEFYAVANVAESFGLQSANELSNNYTSMAIMDKIGQTAAERIEKPEITNTASLVRQVYTYTVKEGESMHAIAVAHRLTTDQIRWSNGLKSTDLAVGTVLYLPSVPGIVYTIKAGDTVDSIASKYQSSSEQIIAFNDLEQDQTLNAGVKIVLPGGVLPVVERPEYVRPAPSYSFGTAFYSASNPMAPGWCTYYAWGRRYNMGGGYVLPRNLGNAVTWDDAAAAFGFPVNRTPAAGAVFQIDASGYYYGHVGIVDKVNYDDNGQITSIVVSDMNGIAGFNRVGSATWEYSTWSKYKYIHSR